MGARKSVAQGQGDRGGAAGSRGWYRPRGSGCRASALDRQRSSPSPRRRSRSGRSARGGAPARRSRSVALEAERLGRLAHDEGGARPRDERNERSLGLAVGELLSMTQPLPTSSNALADAQSSLDDPAP